MVTMNLDRSERWKNQEYKHKILTELLYGLDLEIVIVVVSRICLCLKGMCQRNLWNWHPKGRQNRGER